VAAQEKGIVPKARAMPSSSTAAPAVSSSSYHERPEDTTHASDVIKVATLPSFLRRLLLVIWNHSE
jgi:hypothetical protein